MKHLKKMFLIAVLLLLGLRASAQSVKQEIKKAYLKTCLDSVNNIHDNYEQRLYRWWCECSAEKVSNHFGLTDFIRMKYMDKKKAANEIKEVIQSCTNEYEKNMKKYKENKK